jgi:thiol-disulfide isomerase/thioredoxin
MKILKIGAVWCSGCLVMKPRWQKIEKEITGLNTEYFDFDERKDIVEKYKIENTKLPVFIFLDNQDNELERLTGEIDEKVIIDTINKYQNL